MMRTVAIALTVVLALSIARAEDVAKPAQLPINGFTRYDEVHDIQLSPSGDYIAYVTGKYGRSIVAVINRKEKKLVGGIRCPEGKEIFDYDWTSNSRLIFQLAERQTELVEPTPTGEIMAADFDGNRQVWIYGYRVGEQSTGTHLRVKEASYATPSLISTLREDDKNILIAEHPWKEGTSSWYYDPDAKPYVTKLSTVDGKKERVTAAPLANATILVDHKDQVRFAIGENDKHETAVSWKAEPNAPWAAFDFPGFREESVLPRIFGEDDQSVLFTGVREGEKYSALYRLDLQSKAVTKVFAFDRSGVDRVILDFARKKAIGVAGYSDKPLVNWLDSGDRAAKIYASLYRAFPNQSVYITSATDDGQLAIVYVSSDVDPGTYYLFDTANMHADLLRTARSWINPAQMRHKTGFTIKARDGLELQGYVTQPAGTGPFPLVVLPHGGPHGIRDYWGFDSEVQLLANRGYAVLQVNFRGSGGYGMDFESAGYGEWGAKMQDDVTDATHWAVEQQIGQPDRICIYGASYGGYAALMGAVREPKLYRCAIGYAGIYDLELMLSTSDVPRSRSGRAYLDRALGTDHASMRERSPVNHADKVNVPVLLIHGKEDWRADYKQAKKMKAALDNNHKQVELMTLSREGHGAYDEETRREVYERIVKFLDQNLQPANAAAK